MQSEAQEVGIQFLIKIYVIKKIIKIWKMGLYFLVTRSVKGMYFWKNGSVLGLYFWRKKGLYGNFVTLCLWEYKSNRKTSTCI